MKKEIVRFLETEVEKSHLPGVVLSVSHKGKKVLNESIGFNQLFPDGRKMTEDTIFDLASLTKVVATLPMILRLVDEGVINLEDRVRKFLPVFTGEAVTIKHLLTHTSGLAATKDYFRSNLSYEEIIQDICTNASENKMESDVVYSDLGFMLLKEIVERVTQEKFATIVHKQILTPLEMFETAFNPKWPSDRYATTEFSNEIQGYKCGQVHDENAYYMGGVSGHAGLFSTMGDLHKFAEMITNNGVYKGKQLLKEETVNLSRSNFTRGLSSNRGLGWLLSGEGYNPCGEMYSDESYGHTGYTGTSIWFDPMKSLYVIMLTNRVHLGRQPHILTVRPQVHSLIYNLIE